MSFSNSAELESFSLISVLVRTCRWCGPSGRAVCAIECDLFPLAHSGRGAAYGLVTNIERASTGDRILKIFSVRHWLGFED